MRPAEATAHSRLARYTHLHLFTAPTPRIRGTLAQPFSTFFWLLLLRSSFQVPEPPSNKGTTQINIKSPSHSFPSVAPFKYTRVPQRVILLPLLTMAALAYHSPLPLLQTSSSTLSSLPIPNQGVGRTKAGTSPSLSCYFKYQVILGHTSLVALDSCIVSLCALSGIVGQLLRDKGPQKDPLLIPKSSPLPIACVWLWTNSLKDHPCMKQPMEGSLPRAP